MTLDDVRRFLTIANAAGFTSYGRLNNDHDAELAAIAYTVALEKIAGTPEQLLRVIIDAGCDDLPSAGELIRLVYEARDAARRRQETTPALPPASAAVPPSRGWLIARDAYLRDAQHAGTCPDRATAIADRLAALAARNAPPASGAQLLGGNDYAHPDTRRDLSA